MRELLLKELKCNQTEDWGADECRLEVRVDGVLQPPLKRSMNDGNKWTLNFSYKFKNKAEVKLFDEDWPDPDDKLGTLNLDLSLKNNATAFFKEDDADYILWYNVADVPDVDPVEQALREFEVSEKPGVWQYIPKNELLADIRRTLSNPYCVQQGSTQFCGPAAIVFELVSRQPAKYVSICRALYETGKFQGRTKEVEPSENFRNSRVRSGISLADWMLMGTLRDTENAIFSVEESSGPVVMGVTTPWEMKGWIFEILGYDNIEYESTYFYGEFEAMQKAGRVRNQGGVAFLMVHSAMLGNAEPTVAYPEHWVSYLGGLVIDDGVWYRWDSGHIKFDCYSWGRKIHVDLGEGPFEDYFWGVVTGLQ